MRNKRAIFIIALSLALFAGCSLAQPERAQTDGLNEDRFCGFYVVPYTDPQPAEPDENGMIRLPGNFYENPNLTAYGTEDIEAEGMGTLSIDRQVLFAQGQGADIDPVFPGMPRGYCLIAYRYTGREGAVDTIACDMGPGAKTNTVKSEDSGEEVTVSGTIYYGPPKDATADWGETKDSGILWKAYCVWETADERLYLDGSGDSFSGPGNSGFSQTHTYTYSENGEAVHTYTITADVSIQAVPRPERLTVYQYDGENTLLSSRDISLATELPELRCEPGTAWVVVETKSADGSLHTAYDLTEDEIWHNVVLLDDDGFGTYTQLRILP